MANKFIPMIPYLNFSGRSGVRAYGFVNLTAKDPVMVIEFKDRSMYAYMEQLVGKETFAELKKLAEAGEGLATYISKHQHGLRGLRLQMEGSIYANLPDKPGRKT